MHILKIRCLFFKCKSMFSRAPGPSSSLRLRRWPCVTLIGWSNTRPPPPNISLSTKSIKPKHIIVANHRDLVTRLRGMMMLEDSHRERAAHKFTESGSNSKPLEFEQAAARCLRKAKTINDLKLTDHGLLSSKASSPLFGCLSIYGQSTNTLESRWQILDSESTFGNLWLIPSTYLNRVYIDREFFSPSPGEKKSITLEDDAVEGQN